jgi:DNA-directed RNA polymerase subunit L
MSYELRQTTILEAEIDVLREQLTRAKEENIELRAKIEQADNTLQSVLEAYSMLEEHICMLVGYENDTVIEANAIVQIALNSELDN